MLRAAAQIAGLYTLHVKASYGCGAYLEIGEKDFVEDFGLAGVFHLRGDMPLRTAMGEANVQAGFRGWATCVVALCFLVLANTAFAAERTVYLKLPAQPLSQSLRAFATATHQEIIFTGDVVSGHMAPALKGVFPPDEA